MQCEIYKASPKEHDEAVSLISHLPIFVASSLIKTANTEKNESLLANSDSFFSVLAVFINEEATNIGK